MKWMEMKNEVYREISNAIKAVTVYEPNNFETWARAIEAVGKIAQPLVEDGILNDYQIICDEETNDDEIKMLHMFVLKFGWKEHEDDEWTVCDFTISPKGCEICDNNGNN